MSPSYNTGSSPGTVPTSTKSTVQAGGHLTWTKTANLPPTTNAVPSYAKRGSHSNGTHHAVLRLRAPASPPATGKCPIRPTRRNPCVHSPPQPGTHRSPTQVVGIQG